MGSDVTNVLRPLPIDEFIRLASQAGLEVSREDLEQLERRRLIQPYESGSLGRLHLYLLAVYFEAIRVHRHPWSMKPSERTLDEVKAISTAVSNVMQVLDKPEVSNGAADSVAQLGLEIERFLATIDPFGPLAELIDIVRADVLQRLRGTGRLYAELRATASALADTTERFAPAAEVETPHTLEVPEENEDVRTTKEMEAADLAVTEAPPADVEDAEESEGEESEPQEELAAEASEPEEIAAEQSEPEDDQPEDSQPEVIAADESEPEEIAAEEGEPEASEPEDFDAPDTDLRVVSDDEEVAAPQAEPTAEVEIPDEVAAADEPSAEAAEESAPRETPAAVPEAEEPEAEEPRAEESEAEEPPPAIDDEDSRTTQETEKTERDSEDRKNPFSREESSTGRTKALLDRLEAIKAQRGDEDEPSEDGAAQGAAPAAESPSKDTRNLQEKVNELNQLREQLIRAQDWGGLVALYEGRIDLFEDPPDRQQVFLTLATLYELKLEDQENAFRCFHEAFSIPVEAGQKKTLDSLRKIGIRPDVVENWVTWLKEHLESCPPSLRQAMQRDLGKAQAAAGHPQRAFLGFAAYLSESPDDRIDAGALDFLDELSLGVDDEELGNFYDGILENDTTPATRFIVALRAGMFFLGRNEPHHALRCFRQAFDADPTSDIAFGNLSRLYEKEENWGDLRSLIARKLTTAEGEEAERLRRELGRVVENELSTEEAIAKFTHTLDQNPNDEHALNRLVQAYAAMDRFADAYGHLNRLLDKGLQKDQEIRIRKQLAVIAAENLQAPEEAAHHFQRALELSGPDREILEGLASVRMNAGDWSQAISALRLLTGGSVVLGGDRMKKWLNAGIEASRQANRPEDLKHFQDRLAGFTSSAS